MDSITLAAALIYVVVFWTVSWRFPAVALALVFGLAPFQNDLSGGVAGIKFSASEVHLVLSLPLVAMVLLRGDKQLRSWPFLWACCAYFGVCLLSGLVVWRGNKALVSLFQMALFFFVLPPVFSTLARRPQDMIPALWTLLGVATFCAMILLITRSQYILGIHKNGMGGSLGCALLVAIEMWFYYRNRASWHQWAVTAMMVFIAGGLLFTVSRGAWIGAVWGIIFIAAMRRQFALLGRVCLLLVPVLVVCWMALPQNIRDYAFDFDPERGNIEARYNNRDIALDYFRNSPVLGAGVGLRKQVDATQIMLFTLAETGVVGLVTLAWVFVAYFALIWRTQQRLARSELAYSLVMIGGALMLSRLGQSMVDHFWARGPTMMGWAAGGMATSVFLYGPKGSYTGRLRRARALLALHLVEMARRRKRGQSVPALSALELQRANEALALVVEGRHEGRHEARAPGTRAKTARDPLRELAEQASGL